MGLRINQNIMAMNSYRNLTTSETQLSKSLEKLSSGFRINKAADDASGLVISEGLRSQVRGLKMAIKNTQDGVSVVQTAEGALTEVHSLLQRIRELAVQASSTGSSDPAARDAAQAEVVQLIDEVDRIATTTRFGGQKLLDGSYGATLANDGSSPIAQVPAAVTGENTDFTAWTDNTGESFLMSIDGGPAFAVTISADYSAAASTAALAGLINADLTTALAANGYAGAVTASVTGDIAGFVQVTFTNNSTANDASIEVSKSAPTDVAFGQLFGATPDAAGVLSDIAEAAVAGVAGNFASQNGAAVYRGDPAGVVADPTTVLRNYQGNNAESFDFDLNGTTYTVEFDVNATGMSMDDFEAALQTAINEGLENGGAAAGEVSVNIVDDGTGRWVTELRSRETGEGVVLNNVVNNVGTLADDLFGAVVANHEQLEGNNQGGSVFQVGADAGETIHVNIRDIQTTALGIETNGAVALADSINQIDIAADASGSLAIIDAAITQVSTQRGDLGAIQNRFEHTIANLSVTVENLSASESRIRDTDMAEEMMVFTRAQILQQAGTAMLAQANAVPQSVLQLLQ